jgi:ADP-ribose pyrophosphatase YjhB (NUDIX family)
MEAHPITRFNVRVYGLLINEHQQILVTDEVFKNGGRATKFPGGGLELGEGLRDGLAREYQEEAGVEVTVVDHFYTTDFFQPSFFDSDSQIISVYYTCHCAAWRSIKTSTTKFDFTVKEGEEAESFRWVNLAQLHQETDIILPIDKVVVKMLMEQYGGGTADTID